VNAAPHLAAASARRVGGVAVLALRASLRTKVVAALLVLLAVCVVLLPSVIKGDGTHEGDLHILLTYTLGFSFGILCLATLWAACALFAAEIDSSRMQLSAVKPVRAAEFWLGKWLALLVLNAVLLAAVYAGVYAQVCWRMAGSGWEAGDRPSSRRVTRPVLPTPREEALQTYQVMRQQKGLPEGVSEKSVLRVLEARAGDKYDVINPGDQVAWTFRMARPVRIGETVTVRVKFDTEYSTREQVAGVCRLAAAARPELAVEVELNDFTQNEVEFDVDTRVFAQQSAEVGGRESEVRGQSSGDGVQGSGFGEQAALQEFGLSFRHTGDPKKASALMLRFRRDVVLLTPGGTFEANLARAALLHAGVLALLAAFGLTLSACFSLPVAAFVATVLMVLTLVGNSVVQVVAEEDEKSTLNLPGIWVSRGVFEVTQHAMKDEPLKALTRGERIEGGVIGTAAAWNVVLVPFVLLLLGCAALRRRELAAGD
jgi:hypothetical protein